MSIVRSFDRSIIAQILAKALSGAGSAGRFASYEVPSSASLIPSSLMNINTPALGGSQGYANDTGSGSGGANEIMATASVDFFDRRIGGDGGLNGLTIGTSSPASPRRWLVLHTVTHPPSTIPSLYIHHSQ